MPGTAFSGAFHLGSPFASIEGMNEKARALQQRTHRFLVRVLKLSAQLPSNAATEQIVPQLIDAAGSTDSNYRATCRARSMAEFIAKIGVAAEEADESMGWLQALLESNNAPKDETQELILEADELLSIFVKSRKTAERTQETRKAADAARKRRKK
jgi:four helix bundle protein